MNFIAVINKYSRDIKYNKTNLYHYCEEHKKELEDLNIRFKVKSEIELFNMEILLRALDVKDAIEGSYNLFASGHYDMFEYITYEEKRKMFLITHNQQVDPIIEIIFTHKSQEN